MEIQREVPPRPRFRRRSRGALYLACAYWSLAFGGYPAFSQPVHRNLWGNTGMIDMPSARMAPDGEISFGASFFQHNQRYNLTFQALPWLETSFRYSGLSRYDAAYPVYYDRSFAAKLRLTQESEFFPALAIGINDMVGTGLYSGEYVVASKRLGSVDASVGIGWGRLATSNSFRNPITILSSSFDARNVTMGAQPGGANFNILFQGPAGIFGGVSWETPISGLSLIAEYSSDNYGDEARRKTFVPHSQFNFAVSYQVSESFNIGAAWLYGSGLGAHIFYQMNPMADLFPERLGPPLPQPSVRSVEQQQSALDLLSGRRPIAATPVAETGKMADALWGLPGVRNVGLEGQQLSITLSAGDMRAVCANAVPIVKRSGMDIRNISLSIGDRHFNCPVAGLTAVSMVETRDRPAYAAATTPASPLVTIDASKTPPPCATPLKLCADIAAQGLFVEAVTLNGAVATVYYANKRYFYEADAVRRVFRVLMAEAPADIEIFRLVATSGSKPIREFSALRSQLERDYNQAGILNLATNLRAGGARMEERPLYPALRGTFPKFSWSVAPQFRQQLFDPSNPFGVQFLASAEATLEVLPGLSFTGEVEASVYDNFSVNRPSDSVLPHVRTDFLQYFTKGKNGIGYLWASYNFRLTSDIYGVARAGYLESVFAGFGGEILWRPPGERWALGLDMYQVKQRDYDRLLGLRPYEVFTGHISLYYASPWYDLNFVARAGQYLAGDRGITFEMTRRFASGVEIGAFFSKTNVSADKFGEGSFDKGLIIRLPLEFTIPVNTLNEFHMELRPVQRDGGQRLAGDATLYEVTRRTSYAEISNSPPLQAD